MGYLRHCEGMAFIVITGIIAFFPLAVAFGADSQPHDHRVRSRRWL
jgi:hypothetical protein